MLQVEVSPRAACSGVGCGRGGGVERSSFTGRGKELEKAERVSIGCKVPISSSTTELRGKIVCLPRSETWRVPGLEAMQS